MSQSSFVNSGYERIKGDDYQTVDERCIKALLSRWEIGGKIIDPCANNGSHIVNQLSNLGHDARGLDEALSEFYCDWIVTNPPYERPIVDILTKSFIDKIKNGNVKGVAMLMRANWDFASSRAAYFRPPWYSAQIKMRFRPWWTAERQSSPVHNFVWHIWEKHDEAYPIIRYFP